MHFSWQNTIWLGPSFTTISFLSVRLSFYVWIAFIPQSRAVNKKWESRERNFIGLIENIQLRWKNVDHTRTALKMTLIQGQSLMVILRDLGRGSHNFLGLFLPLNSTSGCFLVDTSCCCWPTADFPPWKNIQEALLKNLLEKKFCSCDDLDFDDNKKPLFHIYRCIEYVLRTQVNMRLICRLIAC